MSQIRFHFLGTLVLSLAASFSARAECPANGLAIVVNKANPTEGLSMAQLRRLLLGDLRSWPDKKPVVLIAPDPTSPAFRCILSAVVRMTDAEYHRYIANAEFRGEEPVQLRTAVSAPIAAVQVSAAAGSIAIVEAAGLPSISSSVRVVRINGKQPGEPGYPL
jgi:hypothetical protein